MTPWEKSPGNVPEDLRLKTSDFDYELPPDRIAQTPAAPRDAARLLVLDRRSGNLENAIFRELGRFLENGDLLVLNETRVILARIYARKIPSGGRVELLLLRRENTLTWEVMVGGKRLTEGKRLQVESGPRAEIIGALGGPRRLVRFEEPIELHLEQAGHVPLPPYIRTPLADPERYQTVYARESGSAAAPTAGLHFTVELIEDLQSRGIGIATVTLHIGLDTFAPVTENDPLEHQIHSELCHITPQAAEAINQARRNGGRIVAVGTTSVRTLESTSRIAAPGETVGAFQGPTELFILPGHNFLAVDAVITNFHLPRSTLIMLVSAFAGRERILNAYQYAVVEGYRFYSFGDAMLII